MRGTQDFVDFTNERGIPFGAAAKVDSVMNLIMELECNIEISVNYSTIIPQSVIRLFPLGLLNAMVETCLGIAATLVKHGRY